MKFLKNHPFAVEAFFDSSLVLTFAVSKEQLLPLIPERLALDTLDDRWGFLAVAMVRTRGLRPKGFPKFTGSDFYLIGYRIFVRYTSLSGKGLRGLYIIKSETDQRKMQFFGNIFTHYSYMTTDIQSMKTSTTRGIRSIKSNLELTIASTMDEIALPPGSPFPDWKGARRFAGPLPFTFTYNKANDSVLIIEGVRQNWQPQPVQVLNYHVGLLDKLHLQDVVLANAFEVVNVPYYWKKGRLERWN